MSSSVKTKTPPVDAVELATILMTAGAFAIVYGVLVGTQSGIVSWSWVAPVLLIVGALCVVAGVVIEALRPKL